MKTWNTLFSKKNAYMWDPTEFYDDLEHSIFKIMLTWDQSWFITLLRSLWRHKTSIDQGTIKERSATIATVMTKVFLLNLLRSEIL
jgi:hypothetical protein